MKNKVGVVATVGGGLSAVMGVLGALGAAAACGSACIAGPLVVVFGASIAGFLHEYNSLFIVIGGLLVLLGIVFIVRNKNSGCKCSDNSISR